MILLDFLLFAGFVLLLDQASKAVVQSMKSPPSNFKRSFISIRQTLNRRSVLRSFAPPTLLLVLAMTVAMIVFVMDSGGAPYHNSFGSVGFGSAVGGATSNLLDRMRQGAIIDFIAIGRWPVFNLADVGIVLGLALVLLSMW
jgi:signal peptidase II